MIPPEFQQEILESRVSVLKQLIAKAPMAYRHDGES